MNEEEAELLPPYLRPYPPAGAPLGTLSYNRRSKCWVVKGDPSVTEVCKRLFPGSAGSRRGEARFTAHRRAVGDLCWLMMRFPLEIKASDRALWEKAVMGAREYAVRQAKLSTMPVRMTPPDGAFLGTLRPFQEEGLSYLCSHDRCLLADEMGLGKTVQALAFLSSTGSLPALVIPPAHLTRNWQEETLRFLRVDGKAPRVHTIRGLKPYDLPEADVYIMHYLLLRGWKEALPGLGGRASCRRCLFARSSSTKSRSCATRGQKSTPPRRCCRKVASALSGCPARRFTTAAAKSGTSSTFSTTTS